MDIYAFSNIQVCKSIMQQFKTEPVLEHRGIMIASMHIHKMAQNSFNLQNCWCQYWVTQVNL